MTDRRPHRLSVVVEPIGSAVGAIGGILVWIGLRQHQQGVFLAGAAAVIALLLSFFLRPRLDRLTVDVSAPPRLVAGEDLPLTVTLVAPLGRTTPQVSLGVSAFGLEPSDEPTTQVASPGPGHPVRAVVIHRAPHRGLLGHVHVTVSSAAPFGLVRRTLVAVAPVEVRVHPPFRPAVGLPRSGEDGDTRVSVPDRLGAGIHGVREYRPGDPARAVAWRATARRGRLVVVDRARDPRPCAAVLISGPGHHEAWEEALAGLAWATAAVVGPDSPAFLRALGPTGVFDSVAHSPVEVLDWFAALANLQPARLSDEAAFRADARFVLAGPAGSREIAVRHLTGSGELR